MCISQFFKKETFSSPFLQTCSSSPVPHFCEWHHPMFSYPSQKPGLVLGTTFLSPHPTQSFQQTRTDTPRVSWDLTANASKSILTPMALFQDPFSPHLGHHSSALSRSFHEWSHTHLISSSFCSKSAHSLKSEKLQCSLPSLSHLGGTSLL